MNYCMTGSWWHEWMLISVRETAEGFTSVFECKLCGLEDREVHKWL